MKDPVVVTTDAELVVDRTIWIGDIVLDEFAGNLMFRPSSPQASGRLSIIGYTQYRSETMSLDASDGSVLVVVAKTGKRGNVSVPHDLVGTGSFELDSVISDDAAGVDIHMLKVLGFEDVAEDIQRPVRQAPAQVAQLAPLVMRAR